KGDGAGTRSSAPRPSSLGFRPPLRPSSLVLGPWSLVLRLAVPAVLTLAIAGTLAQGSYWSPYYKIQVYPDDNGDWIVDVNNSGHQTMAPPERKEPFYQRVYELFPGETFRNALVIGAGSGSDTAIALSHGVQHVDAVEIDPVILRLGAELHPSRPYDDPRVAIHV